MIEISNYLKELMDFYDSRGYVVHIQDEDLEILTDACKLSENACIILKKSCNYHFLNYYRYYWNKMHFDIRSRLNNLKTDYPNARIWLMEKILANVKQFTCHRPSRDMEYLGYLASLRKLIILLPTLKD